MNKYILLTSAKNEEFYIENTINSILAQTIKPIKWIIVDDNSVDGTKQIINKYACKYNFIEYFKSQTVFTERNFRSKVFNLNYALSCIVDIDYDFIGTLDVDIELNADYYEQLMSIMVENNNLGIAGGWITEEKKGIYMERSGNRPNFVPGAIQLFNRHCFEQISNFYPLPYGGEDTLMVFIARMNNWDIKSFNQLPVKHLRPTGYSRSFQGLFKYGKTDRTLGYPFLYVATKGISRMRYKPYIIGSLYYLMGYLLACLERNPDYELPEEIRNFVKKHLLHELKKRLQLSS